MIAVVDLERVKPALGILWQPFVVFHQDRMRERGNPTGPVDAVEDFFRGGANSPHKSWTAACQPAVEGFRDIRDEPLLDERSRNPGTADRDGRIGESGGEDCFGIKRDAVTDESSDHLAHPFHAPLSLLRKE